MRYFIGTVTTLISVILAFAFGFSFRDFENGHIYSSNALHQLLGDQSQPPPESEVKNVYNLILTHYIHPSSRKRLKYSAISGMMGSLGDPHTIFMVPKVRKSFDFTTSANFFGIGCLLQQVPNGVELAKVFDGSPAQKAGLKSGDVVYAVNGQTIAGKSSTAVVNKIRGPKGTVVHLSVYRADKPPGVVINVTREQVFAPTVTSHYFALQQIAYCQIATFSEPTVRQFNTAIAKMRVHPLKGLIIDLRENPGGLLNSAADLLGDFAENKTVVTMRHKNGSEDIAVSPKGHLLGLHVPIVILINQDSASAAEIFSGCMHDYGLATLVGTHSYGKETVQNLFQMVDGAGVKITVAKYFLPVTPSFMRHVDADGHYISGGLQPDVVVHQKPGVIPKAFDPSTDAQLAAAIHIIESKE